MIAVLADQHMRQQAPHWRCIWIGEETNLDRGYGTEMMRLALYRCFADQAVKAVLIDPLASNTRAHRFYELLGFKAVDRRMFGKDDCLVHRLEREVWQARNPWL